MRAQACRNSTIAETDVSAQWAETILGRNIRFSIVWKSYVLNVILLKICEFFLNLLDIILLMIIVELVKQNDYNDACARTTTGCHDNSGVWFNNSLPKLLIFSEFSVYIIKTKAHICINELACQTQGILRRFAFS